MGVYMHTFKIVDECLPMFKCRCLFVVTMVLSKATYQEDHGFEFVRAARNQQRLSDIQEEQHEGTSVSDQVTSGDPGAAASGGHNNQHEIHAGAEVRL